MITNIVSNLDIKSYLILLIEIKPYFNVKMGHSSFNIISINKSNLQDNYVVLIQNGVSDYINFLIPESKLRKIIRNIKLNKIKTL